MSDGEAGDSSVLGTDRQLRINYHQEHLHLPDDFPGEPDVVEQSDKERHPNEDVGGVGVGLDKGRSVHQHVISRLRERD
jgi:hypothetical protein